MFVSFLGPGGPSFHLIYGKTPPFKHLQSRYRITARSKIPTCREDAVTAPLGLGRPNIAEGISFIYLGEKEATPALPLPLVTTVKK